MNINSVKNYDILVNLPTDEIQPTEKELQIVNMLFKNNIVKKDDKELKEEKTFKKYYIPLILSLIFFVLSLPTITTIIKLVIPTESIFIPIIIKAIIFYFIILCAGF